MKVNPFLCMVYVGKVQRVDRLVEHGVQVWHDGIIGEGLYHRCGREQGTTFYYVHLINVVLVNPERERGQ